MASPSIPAEGTAALTEREKATLRLLLAGHDAKSIARVQQLSVHTVNERLRDARRKLGVSSSRAAARLLAAREGDAPEIFVDGQIGVVVPADHGDPPPVRLAAHAASRLAWFAGGMLVMSLLVAAVAVALLAPGRSAADPGASPVAAAPAPAGAEAAASAWLKLLDARQWDRSWRQGAAIFQAQVPLAQWASLAAGVRDPLGPVTTRALLGATATTSLPGLPAGAYVIARYRTDFARKRASIETVVLSREQGAWRTAGYFVN